MSLGGILGGLGILDVLRWLKRLGEGVDKYLTARANSSGQSCTDVRLFVLILHSFESGFVCLDSPLV